MKIESANTIITQVDNVYADAADISLIGYAL